MKTRAPGKLILTGEHAVVHGAPALVTAIHVFAECEGDFASDQTTTLVLADIGETVRADYRELARLRNDLEDRHRQFLAGTIIAGEILPRQADLIPFALAVLLEKAGREPVRGMQIRVRSRIPVGCGLGSSAASVLSVLSTGAALLGIKLDADGLFELALRAERLQHGRPSGADPYVCAHGGCCRFREGTANPRALPRMTLELVDTGRPDSTTAECVAAVAPRFKDRGLLVAFEDIERGMEAALEEGDQARLVALVRANHRLLTDLGVVPEHVQRFIARLEEAGGAAKICGAGAVRGPNAGIVWAVGMRSLVEICNEFNYTFFQTSGEERGTEIM